MDKVEKRGIWERLIDLGQSPVYKLLLKLQMKFYFANREPREFDGYNKELGERAVPACIELLRDKSWWGVREYAAHALGAIGHHSAVPALSKALMDENGSVQEKAMTALKKIGKPAVPTLCEVLKGRDVNKKRRAAQVLGEIGDPSAVPALCEALKDEDKDVRRNSAKALEWIVDGCETIEVLERVEKGIDEGSVALRKEKDRDVRIKAQIEIARLTRAIAKKKDELAPNKDLLLDEKPKPPRRGGGVYRTLGRVRNG